MREPILHTRYIYNVLFTIEVILGISIILVTLVYQKILNGFMVSLEQKILIAKFFNTYVLGFQLIACYLCSLSMWRRLWPRRYTPTLEILLGIWLFFCFLIIISGIATTWSMLYSADSLVNTAELMLFRGIDLYYENPEWKLLWDQLQYGEQCCGVKSYKDWMTAKWMPKHKPGSSTPTTPPICEKKEQPKERKRRSLHRRYPHYHGIYGPDRQYYEPIYPGGFDAPDEFPYKNRFQEYMRYGIATTQSYREPTYDQNVKLKNFKPTSTQPFININYPANANPSTETDDQYKVYTSLASSIPPSIVSTTHRVTQCMKNDTTATIATTAKIITTTTTTTTESALFTPTSGHVFAPYACCKKENPGCYRNYLPHMGGSINESIPHLSLTDINNDGCLPLFLKHMSFMLAILVVLLILAILVDIILCCLTKYIMLRNYKDICNQINSTPFCDDEGNSLVLVKCPPNVKCITLEEKDNHCDCDPEFEPIQVGSCVYCSTTHVFNECMHSDDPNQLTATEHTMLIP